MILAADLSLTIARAAVVKQRHVSSETKSGTLLSTRVAGLGEVDRPDNREPASLAAPSPSPPWAGRRMG